MDTDDLHLQLAAINARLCGFTNTARALEDAFLLKRSQENRTQPFRRRRKMPVEERHKRMLSAQKKRPSTKLQTQCWSGVVLDEQ